MTGLEEERRSDSGEIERDGERGRNREGARVKESEAETENGRGRRKGIERRWVTTPNRAGDRVNE